MPEHDELVLAVGPYLLGALDPETRRAVRDHLDTCEICRDELIRLAAVPGFLAQVTPRQADPDAVPPAELRERLISQVIAERAAGRRRLQLVSAAVMLLLLLPVGVFTALRIDNTLAAPDGEPTAAPVPIYRPMSAEPRAGELRGEVGWVPHNWGVELRLQTWGGASDQRLALWAESRDGRRREQVAVWEQVGDQRVPSVGTTSIPAADIGRILVRNEGGDDLLVLEL